MLNVLISPPFKVDPTVDTLVGACAMSFTEIDGVQYLTPYTDTNNSFAGVSALNASSDEHSAPSQLSVIGTGYFKVPVSGAITMNSPLYVTSTGVFSNTQPSTGYTEPVGMALGVVSATSTTPYVWAFITRGV